MRTSFTIALPPTVAPPIVCPPWCVIPMVDHVADLPNQEGYVIHWSADDAEVRHSRAAYVDNTVDPTDPPLIFIDCSGDGISPGAAEQLAQRILAAVREARS